jgi:hypothetical protein
MPAYDAGFKIAARVSGRQLATIGGVRCEAWEPIVSEIQTTERLADRVFRARRGRQRFVVYMEAYTYWKSSAPWSVLLKSAMLSERERLPTISLVFILAPRGYRSQGGQFRLAVEGDPTQQVWFREICMWQRQAEPWWDDVPGLMALSPLCRQERPPREALAHASAAITARTADVIERANLLTTLGIFGKLAYPGFDVMELIGREHMKESPFFYEIMEEGRLEKARQYILTTLKERFGPSAAKEFARRLNAITDIKQLDRLHRLSVRCERLEQFRERFA